MRRTNPRIGLVIGDRLALNQLQPWLVRVGDITPRYLVHGIVAAVGIIAVTSIAVQPRPTPMLATTQPAAVEPSTPLVALEAVTSDAALESSETATTTEEAFVEDAPRKAPLQPIKHTVEEGDSIRMLAARYSVDPVTILAANNLNDPDMLQIGQELIVLPTDGVLYTLRPGESVRRVAEGFGVPIEEIISANELGSSPDLVQPGTQLVVPGATPAWPRTRATAEPGEPELVAASIGGGERLPLEGAARVIPSTRTYEVQSGDTLNGIADSFGVDVATILSNNGISNPNAIKPGVELRILPVKGVEYTVGADETLAEIAWKYQVDLGVLLDYNDLNDPDVINVGNKLVIPGGQRRPEAAPAPAVEVTVPRAQPGAPAPAVVRPAPAAPAASKPAAKPRRARARCAADVRRPRWREHRGERDEVRRLSLPLRRHVARRLRLLGLRVLRPQRQRLTRRTRHVAAVQRRRAHPHQRPPARRHRLLRQHLHARPEPRRHLHRRRPVRPRQRRAHGRHHLQHELGLLAEQVRRRYPALELAQQVFG